MKKKFDLVGYKKLLELSETGKILFFDENHLKLLGYEASVNEEIQYNRKKEYLLLINEYLSEIIGGGKFRSKFREIEKQDSKRASLILEDFQKLETFTIDDDLDQFSYLISEISDFCSEYDEIWPGATKGMSESKFYDLVNNRYLQFQKAFPFENSNN